MRISCCFVLASCLLSACGGSDAGAPQPPPAAPKPPLTSQELDLCTRLAETQLLAGSWGWQQPWSDPIDYGAAGYQNVTGVTALGLFDAWEKDQATGAPQAPWIAQTLAQAKDFLIDVVANIDGTMGTSCSLPNWVFLARYREVFGLTPQEDALVESAWDLLVDSRDAAHGTDPSVRLDGYFRLIQNARTSQGIPGIVGWDCGFILKAALAMGEPATEVDWLRDALKALPVDTTIDYGLDSAAHVLECLALVGDPSMDAALVAAIEGEADAGGGYGGSNPEAKFQADAYVLMAYKAAGVPHDALQDYLEASVRPGGFVYAEDDLETYEQTGEVLLALVR